MNETTFEVRVPADLIAFGFNRETIQHQINEWLVLSLFTDGHVSSGKASQLLNITRFDFLDLLRKRNIAYVDYSADELREEIETVNSLSL